MTELLGVTPKRQTFIHEAGARETSAEAFSPVCSSGVPGKLSPEINPSSVIRSVIKLLPLCITPPPPHINPKSLPPQLHTSLCQSRHLESCQAEGEKNRFCYCSTWEFLPLLSAVATQPAPLHSRGRQAPTSAACSAVLPAIREVRGFEEPPSLCSALPLVRQAVLHELTSLQLCTAHPYLQLCTN